MKRWIYFNIVFRNIFIYFCITKLNQKRQTNHISIYFSEIFSFKSFVSQNLTKKRQSNLNLSYFYGQSLLKINHDQSLLKIQQPWNQRFPNCNPIYLDFLFDWPNINITKSELITTKYVLFLYYRILAITRNI